MKKLTFIIILLTSYFFCFVEATKSRVKREDEDNLRFAITEIQQVGQVVLGLSSALDAKVGEIKTELRKEMQEIRSESRRETEEIKIELQTKLDTVKLNQKLAYLKNELNEIKTEARKGRNELKSEIVKDIQDIGSESRKNADELKIELQTKTTRIEAELQKIFNAVKTEFAIVLDKVQEIGTESRKETDEVKAELRKEIQETKSVIQSKLNDLKSQTPSSPSESNTKIETLQQMITSLSLKQEKSDLQLEKLDTKLDGCNSMINSTVRTGELILQQVNNTNLSVTQGNVEMKLEQLNSSIKTFNSSLNSVVAMGTKILDKLNTTSEDSTLRRPSVLDSKSQLNQVLASVDNFKTQAAIYTGKAINGANEIVETVYGFLTKMATAQMNETLENLSVIGNKAEFPVPELWPMLKMPNLPPNLLIDAFKKFSGVLRGEEWVLIQTRGVPLKSGRAREPFYRRTWTEYRNGFGSYDADYWFGLDKIHYLTNSGFTELRIEMEDWEGNHAIAQYNHFQISDRSDNYRLSISGYSGSAGDSMNYNNGMQFSTVDKDNDMSVGRNCALNHGGPWWTNSCSLAFLNYDYQTGSKVPSDKGIIWFYWKLSLQYSLKKVEMKIRRPRSA